MRIIGLHSQRVLGFRCLKSPALIPEEREYQGAGARGIRKNQKYLKWSSNTTEGYAAATQRHKKAVDGK